MTTYISDLLQPLFAHVRVAFLRDPVACELFVPILRCEGASATNYANTEVDAATLLRRRLYFFINNSFPEPRISTLQHIPSLCGSVGRYIDHFSIVIHGRIAEALAMEVQQLDNSPTHRRRQELLRFLITVNIIHDFAHIARSFFNGIHLEAHTAEGYPYTKEYSNTDYFLRLPEAGYMAEQAFFGGIVGVVFQDEIEGERPPFFEIRYNKILYFFLQCADGRAYRLDFDVVATKLEHGLLTPFDTSTLPNIPVPKSPNERTCAWLNSTHIPRPPGHPDESHGVQAPLSPPTSRAEQMERDLGLPITRTDFGFLNDIPKHPEHNPWYYSPWPSAYPTTYQRLPESLEKQERWTDVPGTARTRLTYTI